MTFEQKPMVAFYRNEERFRRWATDDTLAMAADSLLQLLRDDVPEITSNR